MVKLRSGRVIKLRSGRVVKLSDVAINWEKQTLKKPIFFSSVLKSSTIL